MIKSFIAIKFTSRKQYVNTSMQVHKMVHQSAHLRVISWAMPQQRRREVWRSGWNFIQGSVFSLIREKFSHSPSNLQGLWRAPIHFVKVQIVPESVGDSQNPQNPIEMCLNFLASFLTTDAQRENSLHCMAENSYHSQIFKYGGSTFYLQHRPNFQISLIYALIRCP